MKPFQAIAAMSLNRAIGLGGRIPWHLPEDFRWFKQKTMGHALVMGRKTYESIGKPLPGRETYVLSRQAIDLPGVKTIQSLDDLARENLARDVFICGGAQLYRLALPLCSDLYLTVVKQDYPGDTFFPPFEGDFTLASEIADNERFVIRHFTRRQPLAIAGQALPAPTSTP
jgi:dihydrofolate reductase